MAASGTLFYLQFILVLLGYIVTWEHGHIVGVTLHHACEDVIKVFLIKKGNRVTTIEP